MDFRQIIEEQFRTDPVVRNVAEFIEQKNLSRIKLPLPVMK